MWDYVPKGIVAALVAVAWACAGTPGPGDAGYPFNLSGTYAGWERLSPILPGSLWIT